MTLLSMDLAYCLRQLRPDSEWTVGETMQSVRMMDGSDPPSEAELQAVWSQREEAMAAIAGLRGRLHGVLATFNAGQEVAYKRAITAVSEALDAGDTDLAREIVETYPNVDPALRAQLIACFVFYHD